MAFTKKPSSPTSLDGIASDLVKRIITVIELDQADNFFIFFLSALEVGIVIFNLGYLLYEGRYKNIV